jgi:NADH-quinone oxidoreductase subunit C
MPAPKLDHPTLPLLKAAFPDVKLLATEFRGQTTVIVPKDRLHEVMRHLREASDCGYDFLSDLFGIDYLDYPVPMPGRFAVAYLLIDTKTDRRLTVKVHLDPTMDTSGTAKRPGIGTG